MFACRCAESHAKRRPRLAPVLKNKASAGIHSRFACVCAESRAKRCAGQEVAPNYVSPAPPPAHSRAARSPHIMQNEGISGGSPAKTKLRLTSHPATTLPAPSRAARSLHMIKHEGISEGSASREKLRLTRPHPLTLPPHPLPCDTVAARDKT